MLFDWWERYRWLILLAGAALFVAVSLFLYQGDGTDADLPLETPAYAMEPKQDPIPEQPERPAVLEEKPPDIYVDVKGSVKQPGLYRFSSGERVFDAIAKAGGALPDADMNRINLAEPLADGSVVRIPKKGELLAEQGCPCPNANGTTLPTAAGKQPARPGLVNLNSATLEELMTLPGVGQTRAQSILDYRRKNGPFRRAEEIQNVPGIGDKMYEQMKRQLTVQ